MSSFYLKSIQEINRLLVKREILPSDILKSTLDRVKMVENRGKSYLFINENSILEYGERLDKILTNKDFTPPPLFGIPISVKDNISTKGIKTTAGSKMLSNYIPPFNATVIDKIDSQYGVISGKTNMDEFGIGVNCANTPFQKTLNPYNKNYYAGGSSGGCATSVALDEAIISIGSDTGGSLRVPASFNNLFGLKPTYGTVSRYGLISFASSLDQIGIISKNIEDLAVLLEVIMGYDFKDSTSLNIKYGDFLKNLKYGLKGVKIGVPVEYLDYEIDKDIFNSFKNSINIFKEGGAEVIDISIPNFKYHLPTYNIISSSEASSNLARYDGIKFGDSENFYKDIKDFYIQNRTKNFGFEVKKRVILGNYNLLNGNYEKAEKVRSIIEKDFIENFKKVDLILTPTTPSYPSKVVDYSHDKNSELDIFTVGASLGGYPAISIPAGFSYERIPIGVQLIGKKFEEQLLLNGAYSFQNLTNWGDIKPILI